MWLVIHFAGKNTNHHFYMQQPVPALSTILNIFHTDYLSINYFYHQGTNNLNYNQLKSYPCPDALSGNPENTLGANGNI